MNRLSKRSFGRPSPANPLPDYFSGKMKENAQVGKGSKHSIYCKVHCRSSVKGLIPSCFPRAISRLIAFVIIQPFKGKSFRPLSHVGKKISKISPSITDGDSPPSIVHPSGVALVEAPLNHHSPRSVCGTFSPLFITTVAVDNDSDFSFSKTMTDKVFLRRHGIVAFIQDAVLAVGVRLQPTLTAILG